MKKFVSALLAGIILVTCLASCGTHAAAKALDTLLASVKTGDFANSDILADSPFANENDEMLAAMYKNFNYEIGEVKETDGGATVALSVTTTDVGEVFMNYMTEALASSSDEEALFIEMLNREDAPLTTFDIEVAMVETDGVWSVAEENEDLVDALTGGLFSSLSGMLE